MEVEPLRVCVDAIAIVLFVCFGCVCEARMNRSDVCVCLCVSVCLK